MTPILLILILACIFLFGLFSKTLSQTLLSMPMIFTLLGIAIGLNIPPDIMGHEGEEAVHLLAEITLIIILFADASRLRLEILKQEYYMPQRLLGIGMPLTVLLGAGIAVLLFPGFSWPEAALLAAILAPTDAALGQAVVSSEKVPINIRQALNVESGLNDGIALPLILFLASLATGMNTHADMGGAETDWVSFVALQLTLGPLWGAAIGYIGAKLVEKADKHSWCSHHFTGISTLAIAFLCYLSASMTGGNGFIAAFVGGLVMGNTTPKHSHGLFDFAENEGQVFMMLTFVVFGVLLVPHALHAVTPEILLYALLSLTVIRMIPVVLSMIGTTAKIPTYLFLGWFGPRGLASILFSLLILKEASIPMAETILTITVWTVLFSIFAHGITANPGTKIYAKSLQNKELDCEIHPVGELPVRKSGI